jgi:CheY-like chemotaxis protein
MEKIFENRKLLWVEDDAFLSSLIGQRFGDLGATLFGASNGKRAIEIAKLEKPDVILLDVLLPELGGFEVLKTLKEDDTTKHIPVIILSNLSQKSDIEKGKELGAASYLVKATVNLDEIVNEVKKVLRMV